MYVYHAYTGACRGLKWAVESRAIVWVLGNLSSLKPFHPLQLLFCFWQRILSPLTEVAVKALIYFSGLNAGITHVPWLSRNKDLILSFFPETGSLRSSNCSGIMERHLISMHPLKACATTPGSKTTNLKRVPFWASKWLRGKLGACHEAWQPKCDPGTRMTRDFQSCPLTFTQVHKKYALFPVISLTLSLAFLKLRNM